MESTGSSVSTFPEDNDNDEVLSPGDGRDEDEGGPALCANRGSSSYDGSSSGGSSSSGGYDQPPRRRARLEGGRSTRWGLAELRRLL